MGVRGVGWILKKRQRLVIGGVHDMIDDDDDDDDDDDFTLRDRG